MLKPPDLAGHTVLIMEDEFIIAMDLESEILDTGATVLGPFARSSEGLETLRDQRPDIAILDVALADGEVFPVAEALEENGVPFIFHTAHGERAELQARFGDVVVCHKPIPPAQIAEQLHSILAKD